MASLEMTKMNNISKYKYMAAPIIIGVEVKETRNLAIYLHWGFNSFIRLEIEDGNLILYFSKSLKTSI